MSGFLTVEDWNSVTSYQLVYDVKAWSGSLLRSLTPVLNKWYYVDFFRIKRTGTSSSEDEYTIQVVNKLVNGYYYASSGLNPSIINVDEIQYPVWITSRFSLCLTSFMSPYSLNRSGLLSLNLPDIYVARKSEQLDLSFQCGVASLNVFCVFEYDDGTTETITPTRSESTYYINSIKKQGLMKVFSDNDLKDICLLKFHKNNLILDINPDLTIGTVNTININTPFNLQGVTGKVNGEPTDFSNGTFQIDLTDYTKPQHHRIRIEIDDGEYNPYTYEFRVESHYSRPTNFTQLRTQIMKGARVLDLTRTINCTADLYIDDDLSLISTNGYGELNLQGHSIHIGEEVKANFQDIIFSNGDPAILQSKQSGVKLEDCTFTHNTHTEQNNLGSAVSCDIDKDSLSITDDFRTVINGCRFEDNHNCILHGGTLEVTGTTVTCTDKDYIDNNNPYFLFLVDGEAIITNNVFNYEIDGTDETVDIVGFSQAIAMIGENALFNNANYTDLQNNNTLPLQSNSSTVQAKYYYPKIEANVETKGTACHCLSGQDFIFKDNATIRRIE